MGKRKRGNPFDGPDGDMVRVEFFANRGASMFSDRIYVEWIEQESQARSQDGLKERAYLAFGQNLWVIEQAATRQSEFVDQPTEVLSIEEVDDPEAEASGYPTMLRVYFSE